jgi:hypothetical protein
MTGGFIAAVHNATTARPDRVYINPAIRFSCPFLCWFVGMLEPYSTVNAQCGAGDVIGVLRSEERGGLADVFRSPKPAPR